VREVRYLVLVGELAKKRIFKKNIAECLGIHRNSVTNKLNGGSFSVEEAVKIRDTFFPEWKVEDLFKVEETEVRQ
jgi:plasmid maintenance system antidote protein VapI